MRHDSLMSDFFKPLPYLLAIVVVGTLCLWLLIGQFLGSTSEVAANLPDRAAFNRSQSSTVEPQSVDGQSLAHLQKSQLTNATPVQDRDAADSADRATSVPSELTPVVAERADSDEDIQTRKSIKRLELEVAVVTDLPGDEFVDATSDPLPLVAQEASLNIAAPSIKPEPVVAIDVSLDLADQCTDRRADAARVGVRFRPGSFAIKGRSLSELDLIVEAARQCESSVVVVEIPAPYGVDDDRDMAERRADEIKYYLLQRGIDKEFMRFQDRS